MQQDTPCCICFVYLFSNAIFSIVKRLPLKMMWFVLCKFYRDWKNNRGGKQFGGGKRGRPFHSRDRASNKAQKVQMQRQLSALYDEENIYMLYYEENIICGAASVSILGSGIFYVYLFFVNVGLNFEKQTIMNHEAWRREKFYCTWVSSVVGRKKGLFISYGINSRFLGVYYLSPSKKVTMRLSFR